MSRILPEWQKKSVAQLQKTLSSLHSTMIDFQNKTDYTNAELYRSYHENCQNYILERTIRQKQSRHNQQIDSNNKSRAQELACNKKNWEQRIREYNNQYENLLKQLDNKYQQQASALRMQMQQQLSTVVKQSHQLINLRKMEQHASKQKNFVQAHSIQQKIKKLYEAQRSEWMEGRQKTIQLALKNLRTRQNNQIQGINRKNKLTMEDYAHGKFKDDLHINQKYDNMLKQLKCRHQREILSLHGQLRNSGGKSPKRRNKAIKTDQKSQISQD